jgi:phosphoribosylanthranilate isomerase
MTMPTPLVKICGLSTPETLDAAIAAGAQMAGFVFFAPSPRNLDLGTARALGARAEGRIARVALTVDADDVFLDAAVEALRPDLLQLHGKESPARTAAIRARFGLPVMKAIGVSDVADLAAVTAYEDVVDRILFDAKPPRGAVLPGGNGLAFDWTILRHVRTRKPWMLSGGLDASNVGEAVRISGAGAVDVSSGVESAPGVKDPQRIAAFVAAVRKSARPEAS